MRMSDIVGYLDLSVYPQVALVLFLGVFAAVVWRATSRSRRAEFEAIARIPLVDEPARRDERRCE
ncbi:MAG: hypothetical protein AMXMBFR58_13260 [Phycisphaerae bacterium]|nr:hypothetical protein [Phycisphaerales bacterium]